MVLNASSQGATIVLPRDAPAIPVVGEVLHLLLETKGGPLPDPVRADVLDVLMADNRVSLVCAFRKTAAHAEEAPTAPQETRNRRDAFRVSPKAGERVPITIIAEDLIEGWLVDVSAAGMRIATRSKSVHELKPSQEVRLQLTIPGFEVQADTDCSVVWTVRDVRPYQCALRFKFRGPHSDFERMIVGYVMRRQREIIQQLRGLGN